MSEAADSTPHWRNLIAACAAVCVFSFSLGEMFPLLALKLESWGTSAHVIGLNAAMSPLGILVAGLIVPKVAHRFGPQPVALAAALATGVVILGYPLLPNLTAWFILRFCQGACVATLFALSEAWVVRFAEGRYHARITGIYASVLSASFGLGGAVPGLTGIDTALPFIIGAIVLFSAALPVWLVEDNAGGEHEQHVPLSQFLPKTPLLILAVLVFAIFDGGLLGFLSVYAVYNGASIEKAALFITALSFGNVLLQPPIGWLADHFPKRIVMAGCFLVTALGLALMPLMVHSPLIWVLLPVMGAAGFAVYSLALAMLGDEFSGPDLIAGTGAFSAAWGLGALIGSVLCGAAMDIFGSKGLPGALLAVILIYLCLDLFSRRHRR